MPLAHTQDVRFTLVAALIVLACETATPPAETATPPSPARSGAPPAARQPSLVYAELLAENGPLAVRTISLAGGPVRDLATVAPKLDARFALSPDERTLAILERQDQHEQRTSRWRLRLVDLAATSEREAIASRVDTYEEVPWDVGWSPGGALLLASPRALSRVAPDGAIAVVHRFVRETLGATFRDPAHPGIVVSQTTDAFAIHLVRDDGSGATLFAERPLAGVAGYARRPGSDEIVELVTRFDGRVAFSLLQPGLPERSAVIDGPRVDGLVELVGTTPNALYALWPVARSDPVALDVIGTAFFVRIGYDGATQVVDATRNWGPAGPLGLSPDGSALLVPIGARRGGSKFALAVCCATRPARPLLPPAERAVIGWLAPR